MTVAMTRAPAGLATPSWPSTTCRSRVQQGESIGLMGLNGSGKSTLLKLVTASCSPTQARCCTRGRIAGLIATGAGFHPQLTGRENIYLNAADPRHERGRDQPQVRRDRRRSPTSASFLDRPVGLLLLRHVRPPGLRGRDPRRRRHLPRRRGAGRGRQALQGSAWRRCKEIRDSGATIFYVSHAAGSVRKICDRVLVLEKGGLGFDGDVDAGIKYLEYDDDSEEHATTSSAPRCSASLAGRARGAAVSVVEPAEPLGEAVSRPASGRARAVAAVERCSAEPRCRDLVTGSSPPFSCHACEPVRGGRPSVAP